MLLISIFPYNTFTNFSQVIKLAVLDEFRRNKLKYCFSTGTDVL